MPFFAVILGAVAIILLGDLDLADKMASVIAAATGVVALVLQMKGAARGHEEPPVTRRFWSPVLVLCAVVALGGLVTRSAPEPGTAGAVVTLPGTAIDHPAEGSFVATCSESRGNAENVADEAIWLISRNPDGTPYFAREISVPGPWRAQIQLGAETPVDAGARFRVELYAVPDGTALPADPSQPVTLPARARKLDGVTVRKDPDRIRCDESPAQ
ncbi:hypothetical protein [Herbidospora yilanensis]|uniref:hypothetical protein n=1 Tax=Herbidospora yilanensis TaxID=354426 RepID=UPI00078288EF|nr:hypothetical protein [Herbidospora yilanensis]